MHRFRPLDYLAVILSLGCVGALAAYAYQGSGGASHVEIQGQGGPWIYPLDQDRELTVEGPVGPTTITIHSGGVHVLQASCPDKTCVTMGTISTPGAWLACLPNRLFIRIQGSDAQIDATSF